MSKPHLHKVIGIDLGTTYSAVASFNSMGDPKLGMPESLFNSGDGDGATTASVISLDPLTRKAVVGAWAKRNRPADPANTIVEIKREMGEPFSKDTLAKYHGERGGYVEGQPVHAHFAGQWLLPQEISAFTLMRMKQVAEEEIGEEIRDAVITVPAYFTERQRAATREAALLAGLYPRQILPEPTAAAIAYGLEKFEADKKLYLVYDLGGGTFDVSIIEVEGQKTQVIATSGDSRLGGGDFDDAIAAWAIDQLNRQFGLDLTRLVSERAMRFRAELKLKAEQSKIILSNAPSTNLSFPELMSELHLQTPPILPLTREKFEELIGGHLRRSLNYVDEAIKKAAESKSVRREDISAIILVGGSSKIPRVKSLLLDYFQQGEDFVKADADPDQIVARGAAIEAFKYQPSPPPFDPRRPVDNTSLRNPEAEGISDVFHITEHTLGVGVQGGRVARIIAQGTNVPTEITEDNFTNAGPSDNIPVHVFQGESQFQAECTQIGMVPITGLEPLPEGKHRFAVTFKLDMSGLLTAEVRQVSTGQIWAASFQHKAGVGGLDAIAALRTKLLGMYAGTVSARIPPPILTPPPVSAAAAAGTHPPSAYPPPSVSPQWPASQPPVPGPTQAQPWPPVAATAVPQPPWTSPPQSVTPPWETSQPPAANVTQAQPPSPLAPAPESSASPAPVMVSGNGQPAPSGSTMISPARELVPEQARLVRRTHKFLLEYPNAKLARICNKYVTALNEGATGDDLSDLYDDLSEAFTYAKQQAP